MDESWMKLFVLLAAMVSNIINCSVGVLFRGSVLVILLYCCERQWVFNVSLCPNKLTDEHSLCTLWHAFLHIVKWNIKPCCIFSRVFSNRVGLLWCLKPQLTGSARVLCSFRVLACFSNSPQSATRLNLPSAQPGAASCENNDTCIDSLHRPLCSLWHSPPKNGHSL